MADITRVPGSLLAWTTARVRREGIHAAKTEAVRTAHHWRTLRSLEAGATVAYQVCNVATAFHGLSNTHRFRQILVKASAALASAIPVAVGVYTLRAKSEVWTHWDDDRNWRAYWVLHFLFESLAEFCRDVQQLVCSGQIELVGINLNELAAVYDEAVTEHYNLTYARFNEWPAVHGVSPLHILSGYNLVPTAPAFRTALDVTTPNAPRKHQREPATDLKRLDGVKRRLFMSNDE